MQLSWRETFDIDVSSMGVFPKWLILESDVEYRLTTSTSCCVIGVVDVIESTRSTHVTLRSMPQRIMNRLSTVVTYNGINDKPSMRLPCGECSSRLAVIVVNHADRAVNARHTVIPIRFHEPGSVTDRNLTTTK
jgi:hypothetical protein